MTKPYEGTNNSGHLQDDPEYMTAAILDGHAAGWQLAIHAIGDRALDFTLDTLEEAHTRHPRKNTRHRIEHCGTTRPEQLDRIATLKAIPVIQPTFLYDNGNDYSTIMGEERTTWLYRGKSFLDKGITIAGSSDRPVTEGAPLRAIQFMVNRTAQNGKKIGPAEAITVDQALTAYTRGSAYACNAETSRGTITPGKLADFAILADDPRTYDTTKINAIKILATFVAGEAVHNPANLTST